MYRRLVVLLLVLLFSGVSEAQRFVSRRPHASSDPAIPSFPLTAHASGRYLVDTNGTPVPILGRVTWLMVPLLTPTQIDQILSDTVAKGFNAIEIKQPLAPVGTRQDWAGNYPFNNDLNGDPWDGTVPFVTPSNDAPDFTTPNTSYWANIDNFMSAAYRKGLIVFWFPSYVGFEDTDWWLVTMVSNGTTKMGTYGAFIANRYKNYPNIVWMIGGDMGTGAHPFDPTEAAVVEAFNTGMLGVSRLSNLVSCEWVRASICTDLYPSLITLNGTYAAATDINNQGSRAWAVTGPVRPAFNQEAPFEREPNADPPGVMRRLTIWAWISTIGGYLYGNGIFTSFGAEGEPSWLLYENTPGTLDAAVFNRFIRSIAWHTLSPNNAACVSGCGTANSETQLTAATNGTNLAVFYFPPDHSGAATLSLTVMTGTITAVWVDPTTGAVTSAGSFSSSGTQAFTVPGNNSRGQDDWLLKFTS